MTIFDTTTGTIKNASHPSLTAASINAATGSVLYEFTVTSALVKGG
ncbi:MAG: hypothetical protein JW882_14055 [Deltaproteobacteria bacterium]|nr:hypothetical protein [Deltaproteobacteria bacterium]